MSAPVLVLLIATLLVVAATLVSAITPLTAEQAEKFGSDESHRLNDAAFVAHLRSTASSWEAGFNQRLEGMTVGDAKRTLLGHAPVKRAEELYGSLWTEEQRRAMRMPSVGALPESFDSRVQWPGCVHPIRNQEKCGSCWAFSASEVLSDRFCVASGNKTNVVLSPQDLVSCDYTNMGCNGGMLGFAWHYMEHTGVVSDRCMPYTAGTGNRGHCPSSCTSGGQGSLKEHKYHAKNYEHIGSILLHQGRVEKIQTAIQSGGPVQAAFSVFSDFMQYKSGVYQHTSGSLLGGHAIKVVGWGVDSKSSLPYWIVANSWSTTWGMNGFFWILRGQDECGIETQVYAGEPNLDKLPPYP